MVAPGMCCRCVVIVVFLEQLQLSMWVFSILPLGHNAHQRRKTISDWSLEEVSSGKA